MIIKIKIDKYLKGELQVSSFADYEPNSSWYTGQNYFNDHLKGEIYTEKCDAVVLKWGNKNYVFKRKIDDDQRH